MYQVGFIGAGNMGSALAVAAAKSIGGDHMIITDLSKGKMDALVIRTGCKTTSNVQEVASSARFIFLAVKPNVIRSVVSSMADTLEAEHAKGREHILVTIAAGVETETIRNCAGHLYPVIRLMPNTPAAIGKGTTLIAAGADVPESIVEEFLETMKASGSFERIDEEKIDFTSSINGCTPAYAYMFIEALADGAVSVGVPRDQAIRLAAQTVLGSAAMVLESGKHPDQLKDEVCSPGGSTIAGVEVLEANRFRYAAAQAIIQSTEKNMKLGK